MSSFDQELSGWGRRPIIRGRINDYRTVSDLPSEFGLSGNFRSYGDAALAPQSLNFLNYNYIRSFDVQTGVLVCQSGILLDDIIKVFGALGWFPEVVPGTRFVTVGGCIACDVHGKNHHSNGTFTEAVDWFTLLLPSGDVLTCSRQENPSFYATCGGIGLTGAILEVGLRLKKIPSVSVSVKTNAAECLADAMEVFEMCSSEKYSVAWIDCLKSGDASGRSIFTSGDFCEESSLSFSKKMTIDFPIFAPNWALNSFTVKAFNELYFQNHKLKSNVAYRTAVDARDFFFPLDSIRNWNRMYGRQGFSQFQFILPKESSVPGITQALHYIRSSGMGSFLAVLKLYGPQNNNLMSFPMEGYSLALDFPYRPALDGLLRKLTDLVIAHNGRIYLAKDNFMTKYDIEKSYPFCDSFREFREVHGLKGRIETALSKRLSI